jgi:hypothetical protein
VKSLAARRLKPFLVIAAPSARRNPPNPRNPSSPSEWAIAAPNQKARGSIERNIERLQADFGDRLACHPDSVPGEIKREQRDVQTVLFDEFAGESADAFESRRQPINACRSNGVRDHCKKQPTTIA